MGARISPEKIPQTPIKQLNSIAIASAFQPTGHPPAQVVTMSRHASPTAQLLRNSRLFSLPQALPRPIIEQHLRDGKLRSSDSATTPYPLRQAIITPASSAHRGDWGLKRSLPKRGANRSSEPFHTVIANDTYEGVTDYHSASPHVKTLQRFQELNVAMSRQDRKKGNLDSKISAMEPSLDFTDKETGGDARWKYGGGNVRSMTPAEFDRYLEDTVAHRKEEFMLHLRARAYVEVLEEQKKREKKLLQEGRLDEQAASAADHAASIARNAFTDWLLSMRDAGGPVLTDYLAQTTAEARKVSTAATSTYSAAVRYAFRNEWWTHVLEADVSPQGLQLKEKLEHATTPVTGVTKATRPPLGASSAPTWLTFLNHIEEIEHSFLSAWRSKAWDPTGTHFHHWLQAQRKDTTLLSPLNRITRQFLDLPPLPNSTLRADLPEHLRGSEPGFSLSTHPSAGLSYLRTNKLLPNHPILGPQKTGPPVTARVISKSGTDAKTLYGVAGFVASPDTTNFALDLATAGGGKGERGVRNAWVNGEGRVQISLDNTRNTEALGVREGRLEPDSKSEREARERNANLIGLVRTGGVGREGRVREGRARPLGSEAVRRLTAVRREIDGDGRGTQS